METTVATSKLLGAFATAFATFFSPGDQTLTELRKVNTQWNSLQKYEDLSIWGKAVYWATPKETISAGGGDPVDKAIGKMFELVSKGYDERSLKIAITFPDSAPSSAVLLVDYDNKTFVLDDKKNSLSLLSQRSDLAIGYRINRYQFEMDNLALVKKDPSGLKNFKSVLDRMKADGSLKGQIFPELAPISVVKNSDTGFEVDASYTKATNKPIK